MLPQGRLGELLVERGLITNEQLRVGLERQSRFGGRIGSILVKLGFIAEEELLRFLSMFYDVPQVDLRYAEINLQAVRLLPAELAREFLVLPIKFVGRPPDASVLIVATPDPTNFDAIDKVRQIVGCQVEPFVCSFGMFERYFHEVYRDFAATETFASFLSETTGAALAKALARVLLEKKTVTLAELKTALAIVQPAKEKTKS
jgi:hypothetical protein